MASERGGSESTFHLKLISESSAGNQGERGLCVCVTVLVVCGSRTWGGSPLLSQQGIAEKTPTRTTLILVKRGETLTPFGPLFTCSRRALITDI